MNKTSGVFTPPQTKGVFEDCPNAAKWQLWNAADTIQMKVKVRPAIWVALVGSPEVQMFFNTKTQEMVFTMARTAFSRAQTIAAYDLKGKNCCADYQRKARGMYISIAGDGIDIEMQSQHKAQAMRLCNLINTNG